MKTRVLIMGVSGMLGSMVYKYFRSLDDYQVSGSSMEGDSKKDIYSYTVGTKKSLHALIKTIKPDYVINCIGLINKYCNSGEMNSTKNAILVNSIFPCELSEVCSEVNKEIKILQIATDCVFDGKQGAYKEDDPHSALDIYGKTKSLGEINASNFLNIRCSIIGPELYNHVSLFEWVLKQNRNETINGYINHYWNGVTTLEFAQLCEKIILENAFQELRDVHSVLHYTPHVTVSKYELIMQIAEIFSHPLNINQYEDENSVDRTLGSKYNILTGKHESTYGKALNEMKIFMERD